VNRNSLIAADRDAGLSVIEVLIALLIVSSIVVVGSSFPLSGLRQRSTTSDVRTAFEAARWKAIRSGRPQLLIYADGVVTVLDGGDISASSETGGHASPARFVAFPDGHVADVSRGLVEVTTATLLERVSP